MNFSKFSIAAFCVGFMALTQAQTIKPDTLADLKAEYEHQHALAVPYALMYQKAKNERMACAERMIREPLNTFCDAEVRELQFAISMGEPQLEKAAVAKEVYEREQRKAARNKK